MAHFRYSEAAWGDAFRYLGTAACVCMLWRTGGITLTRVFFIIGASGVGGLADHVNSPTFATGVGLVLYAYRNFVGEAARVPVGAGAFGRVAGRIRVAFEVTDAQGATRRLADAGAEVIAEPTRTPWTSLNSRLTTPDGLQITLFQEL
jgi:cell division ATPase FtsA